MPPIPVALVTGFLGSGKTTLVNRLLRAPAMAHALVVVNEFGEVGLDHALIEAGGEGVVLLENGCLCCAVRGALLDTLEDLLRRRAGGALAFDRIVIETSGLADPAPVLHALLSAPTLATRTRPGGVIATIDAVNGAATLERHGESVRQVALADAIVITKLDLVAAEQREPSRAALTDRLRRLNPTANIAAGAQLDAAALVRAFAPPEHGEAWLRAAAHTHAHDHASGIESFAILREAPLSLDALRLLLEALAHNLGPKLLRVKALVHVAEHPQGPAVIQGAQLLLHTLTFLERWPDADRRSKFVFITEGIGRAEILDMMAVLDRLAARTARARGGG